MNYQLIAQQSQMETEALRHVTRALLVAIAWKVKGDDLTRKLSSVRFATDLFQRQVERLFALEELDGYMATVSESHPEWADLVDEMRREHDQFRAVIRKLVLQLELASSHDPEMLNAICDSLQDVVQHILEHSRREEELLVQSSNRDTGGEG